jgi:hypothetical protein
MLIIHFKHKIGKGKVFGNFDRFVNLDILHIDRELVHHLQRNIIRMHLFIYKMLLNVQLLMHIQE